jgi:hypothetical protein
MPEFIVNVREVYIQPYKVTADNFEDAEAAVENGGGEKIADGRIGCSHTLGCCGRTVVSVIDGGAPSTPNIRKRLEEIPRG